MADYRGPHEYGYGRKYLSSMHVTEDRDEKVTAFYCQRVTKSVKRRILRYILKQNQAASTVSIKLHFPGLMKLNILTILLIPQTSPVSIPSFISNILITQTPVSFSPFNSACCIGAAPRYAGSNDGWTFRRRCGWKVSRRDFRRMRPKEAVIRTWSGGEWPSEGAVKGAGGLIVNEFSSEQMRRDGRKGRGNIRSKF